jgi:hypothetical protein
MENVGNIFSLQFCLSKIADSYILFSIIQKPLHIYKINAQEGWLHKKSTKKCIYHLVVNIESNIWSKTWEGTVYSASKILICLQQQ